ncbi:peptide MFS transporter [Flavobacterium microcysteis]|uniref:MFS transporter n=1 Tax=Flavobacterium microcysteis TaxID=2596891 RepID=A0A501Q877_9FLAO|nr:oligopeptide:H+ symporter [Flavobacterium microcysteis]TPD68297.1 MFS transporter [Flavobacterium microcysteis]
MSEITSNNDFFKSKVLGHPSGLFVLFFTEMWERFSFYGMRVLLINFLTMAAIGTNPGWEWSSENAGALFGTYAGLLYLTPIAGGIIADKFTGYRWAVVIGALIMTLGHASLAIETEFSMYFGLGLLVIGTGFFKPNMTSIISEMYKDLPEKKDGAYTIFYMGVNAGAFFGMMLCGYLAEKIGWSWGFGLAGIFMLLGSLQFWLAKPLFGTIGDVPKKDKVVEVISPDGQIDITEPKAEEKPEDKRNPFTMLDKILIVITSIIGLLYLIDDPASKIGNIHLLPQEFLVSKEILPGSLVITIIGLVLFLFLVISRIARYTKVVRHRMVAVIIFAFFTVFFWLSFEQGATSLVLFARDFTDRTLMGNQAVIFNIVNTLLTVIPLALVSWVLFLLFKQTSKKIATSNIVLALSFLGVWGIVGWMLNNDYNSKAYELKYQAIKTAQIDKKTKKQAVDENGDLVFDFNAVTETTVLKPTDVVVDQTVTISSKDVLKVSDKVALHSEIGNFVYLTKGLETKIRDDYKKATKDSQIINAEVTQLKENQVEVTASWFSILNSFFIIAFASMFSKWWDSKYNPSAAVKYGLGLIIMGLGFAILAYGARVIPSGAEAGAVRVSMIWLILAYLFHTWGELCLSPVGLSYVSKLVPSRMIAFMFGMWYLAIAIGNKLAGSLGGMIEGITKEYDMSTFFLIFTIVPIVAGFIVVALNPVLKKLMHGVR